MGGDTMISRCGWYFLFALPFGSPLGCSHSPQPRSAAPLDLSALTTHVEEPNAALGPEGVVVAWGSVASDGTADILLERLKGSHLGGKPVRVNPVSGSAVAGRQVGPRIAVLPWGRILVSWVDRRRDAAGDIVLAASDDGGRTFLPPVRVNDDPSGAGQEYQDVAVASDGTVGVVWLDERGAPAGNENEKQVYFALSKDGGRSFGPNRAATSSPAGVCPCCRPAVACGPDGTFHVIYRDRVADERVVRLASLRPGDDHFQPPEDISKMGWRFPACPVDGPAIVAGPGQRVRVAWMDGSSGRPTVWEARSEDQGISFSMIQASGTSEDASPGRPVLAFHRSIGVVAAWEDGLGRIWLRAIDAGNSLPMLISDRNAAMARSPALAIDKDEVHVFWTEVSSVDPPSGVGGPWELRHTRWIVTAGRLTMLGCESLSSSPKENPL